ncbi:pentapeptide repeat-containing protein [Symplocastrum sp. BBK-W-15]|uniref:Pentapeptide repeat-containing protein n=1 Tax=Limnofasciculus baicalensis BBK-W-15 TaxID=2699891 RepID=A0AAE3GU27_9CYAN|nr:pentapeptide repeat-containing protein [Limnofasciculus baicalensis]MCP2728557.1 pentapeptide repeat-containing protein [Limnofasciculus baicalensis BBK-W-15]
MGKSRKEPDILVVDAQLGLIVIEIKSVTIDQILTITGHRWEFQNYYTTESSPYAQAENQLFALLGYCDREPILRRQVTGRALIALPLITEAQWYDSGFYQLPSCPSIIFRDCLRYGEVRDRALSDEAVVTWADGEDGGNHTNEINPVNHTNEINPVNQINEINPVNQINEINPVNPVNDGVRIWGGGRMGKIFQVNSELPNLKSDTSLLKLIAQTSPIIKGSHLKETQWQLLKAVVSGTPIFRKRLHPPPNHQQKNQKQTRAHILSQIRQNLSPFDLNQEHIAKQIAPGPQRIRGIAGSGKTVLLCQKAAHIHLKHPNWDIALVFFSRSLYQPIITQLDKWLRRFSSGEVGYDKLNLKLQVLHAWGAKNQPGLYGNICQAVGVRRLIPGDISDKQPSESLAVACHELLHGRLLPQLYDAILIDEGQDLIVNNRLKFGGKQPFYWMAYQALRPINPAQPEQRRLIWGYDEAQSLASLNIPNASELFGEELGHLVTGYYPGGIRKTETMYRCYRTPGLILTAAHGIGMGLLRRGGILTGITRVEDWQAIGYEVTGSFLPGQQITVKRPKENSPNPIAELWDGKLLEFIAYRSRQEELTALAENILYNLRHDKLKPSQEILVIVLGSGFPAIQLETAIAEFLISQGIDIYIPSAPDCNILEIDRDNRKPNQFWCEGGVTISRIHRAKGNEADMVYIVGLDNVAKDESNLQLRNQLFVALTRAKGWVKLSGVGSYPMYEELWRVIQSGDSFTFTFRGNPQREISVTDVGEVRSRYDAGGRNFQNADLAGARLAGADLREANLIGAILSKADLRHAKLDGAKLVIADLSGADLSYGSLRKAKLVGANLQAARLIGADLSWAKLANANLGNAELVGANLTGVNLTGADLTGADLTGANLDKVDLSEVDLSGVRMSDGRIGEELP